MRHRRLIALIAVLGIQFGSPRSHAQIAAPVDKSAKVQGSFPPSQLGRPETPTPGFGDLGREQTYPVTVESPDHIVITFVEKVWETVNQMGPNGKAVDFKVEQHVTRQVNLPLDTNLDEIDLPPDGKRLAVLTITAKRHEKLLQTLLDAKSEEEKTAATEVLQANYSEHYAIETWWRQQKLEELETQLKELREQVQQRVDAQEKYVAAAMTLAGLHAQGIAIAPPKPVAPSMQGPAVYSPNLGVLPAERLGRPAQFNAGADYDYSDQRPTLPAISGSTRNFGFPSADPPPQKQNSAQ